MRASKPVTQFLQPKQNSSGKSKQRAITATDVNRSEENTSLEGSVTSGRRLPRQNQGYQG